MEGIIPYVYKAVLQYRCNNPRMYGTLATAASSPSPGNSGRFYVRLPGDSGRFASEIHGLLTEAVTSPRTIYRPPPSPQSLSSKNEGNNHKNGSASMKGSLCCKTTIGVRSPPGFSGGQHGQTPEHLKQKSR